MDLNAQTHRASSGRGSSKVQLEYICCSTWCYKLDPDPLYFFFDLLWLFSYFFTFVQGEWILRYNHTTALLDAPNQPQIHCLNLTLTLILTLHALLDAWCVYTLKCALQIFKQQLTFKTRKCSRISIVFLQTSLYCGIFWLKSIL